MNKFIYDGVVTGQDFCDRPTDIKKIMSYVNDSTNVLLIAKRRMGKTSLVHEIYEHHLNTKDFVSIYVDIFDITDELDFAKELYQATAKALRFDLKQALNQLKDLFKNARFNIGLSDDGSPTFTPSLATKNSDELLEDVFNGLNEYVEKNNLKAVFCIDEFQQISQIKKPLDATIRKHIQRHKNICYIFSGSKRSSLLALFQGQASPLMGMVTPMELKEIGEEVFFNYVTERIDISKEEFSKIYESAEYETKLIQHICRNYSILEESGESSAENAIDSVLSEVDSICRSIIENLSPNAKKVIKVLSSEDKADQLMSKEILQKYNISKSSMASSIESLLKNEMIFKENGSYYLDGGIGATFSLWCKKNLGRNR